MLQRIWRHGLTTVPERYVRALASIVMRGPGWWFRILAGFVAATAVFIAGTRNRALNWDVIPYLALVAKPRFEDWSALHIYVYESLQSFMGEASFRGLVSDGLVKGFRETVFSDHSALEQISLYYHGRLGYITLAQFLVACGLGDLQALMFLSAASAAAIAFIVGFTISGLNVASFILVFALLSLCHVFDVARLVTPDALAAALAISVAILLRRQEIGVAMAVVILALCCALVLVRADFSIFVMIFLVVRMSRDVKKVRWLVGCVMCIAAYGLVMTQFPSYGYWALFYHTFVEPLPYPENGYPTLSISEIAWEYFTGGWTLTSNSAFVVLGAGVITLLGVYLNGGRAKIDGASVDRHTMMGSLLFVAAHFVLFPSGYYRFYVAPLVLVSIALVEQYWRDRR